MPIVLALARALYTCSAPGKLPAQVPKQAKFGVTMKIFLMETGTPGAFGGLIVRNCGV
jgi:hypothetical protein